MQQFWKMTWRFSKKLNIEWSGDPNSTILGIHPNNGYQDVQDGSTVMLSIALLTARKKQKQVKWLWHECIDCDSSQMLWEAPNQYLSLLLRTGPRDFESLDRSKDQAHGSYGHLMTLSSVALGQNWTARWPKCSDEVPVLRRKKEK
jgi:hypothetical protein